MELRRVLSGANKTLTATYAPDGNYNGSSGTKAHTVNPAATTTTIGTVTPEPSVVGQAYTVNFTVAAQSPGSGTPTGSVTVSDGRSEERRVGKEWRSRWSPYP